MFYYRNHKNRRRYLIAIDSYATKWQSHRKNLLFVCHNRILDQNITFFFVLFKSPETIPTKLGFWSSHSHHKLNKFYCATKLAVHRTLTSFRLNCVNQKVAYARYTISEWNTISMITDSHVTIMTWWPIRNTLHFAFSKYTAVSGDLNEFQAQGT